jgi:superfamily I DNA/RNA helicase
MQSIYGFREAEVELFERLKTRGFEIGFALDAQPYRLDFVSLRANFRTVPTLVNDLNDRFERIFAIDDGSGVSFSSAVATRESASQAATQLHLAFAYQGNPEDRPFGEFSPEPMRARQMQELVALIRERLTAAGRLRAESARGAAKEMYRIAVLARTRSSLVRVAQALDDAGIGYRAIDLVQLRERAEVLDVLALARALMNPVDRTAWLAVLRAPWCGLTLEDLHRLTSADDAMVLHTPVRELLATRLPQLFRDGLLSGPAFHAANRVGRVLREAAERRAGGSAIAHQTLGTWLESVWKALGGAATVNPSQLENLRLLWSSLDELPEGEVDLLGAGLHAALENLFALPDPGASSSFGVQLMTIHKSKGLEFEVVIVPDLEAAARNSTPEMISWLERGLPGEDAPQDESQLSGGQLTEFLIAPIQARGTDRGTAKEWVDGVNRARETQELRRVLYVAATRARQELHLFARPRFAIRQRETGPILNTEAGLLKTAWPAFGEQAEAEFRAWCAAIQDPERPDATEGVVSLAASGGNLLQMPGPGDAFSLPKAAMLRRLPPGYQPPDWNRHASLHAARDSSADLPGDESRQLLYRRTAGGMESRLLGTAIHALLEHLTALRMTLTPTGAAAKLPEALPALVAEIRSHGLRRTAAERLAAEALHVAREASLNATGAWILSPHTHAETESRWTGLIETGPIESDSIESDLIGLQNEQSSPSRRRQRWNVRPDRVFYAPMPSFLQDFPDTAPGTPEPQWWIIDYKSSQGSPSILTDPREQREFLKAHRNQYAAQLDAYAQVLRQLRLVAGDLKPRIRIGIFYPRLRLLDHWT